MYVYRVEDTKGIGPYVYGLADTHFSHHNNSFTHPTPMKEKRVRTPEIFKRIHPKNHRYAFRSLQAYHNWFNEADRQVLQQYNYRLVKYKVPIDYVNIMSKQVQFYYKKAVRLETLPISE